MTRKLLEDMDISDFVVSKETIEVEVAAKVAEFREVLAKGKQVVFVVKKDVLEFSEKIKYENGNIINREEIIKHIMILGSKACL